MKLKKLIYDYKYSDSYGGGGYWVLNYQKIFNIASIILDIALLIILIIKLC
jgi:hypothetical protein